MPKFRNTGEILKELGGRIDYARNQLAKSAKAKLKELTDEWYNSYTPKRYKRTNQFRNSIRTRLSRNPTRTGFYSFELYYDYTIHGAKKINGEFLVDWINRTGGYGSEENKNMVFKGRTNGGYSAAFTHDRPKQMIERTGEWLSDQIGSPSDMQRWLSSKGGGVNLRIRRK